MTSLISISTEMQSALESIAENEGELDDNVEAKISFLNQALVAKTDGVVEWIGHQNDVAAMARRRAAELNELAKRIDSGLEKFDSYVDMCLKALGQTQIEGNLYKIVKRKPSQVVVIDNENEIPIEFIKVPEPVPQIMKSEISKALKAGQTVAGARLTESDKISISYKVKSKND